MSGGNSTGAAGGVQLVDTSGRPARPAESEQGEHSAGSVLSLETGAGPTQSQEGCMAQPRRPARPVRFDDPGRNAAYWARIDRIVAAAPALSTEQKAILRGLFHTPAVREAA